MQNKNTEQSTQRKRNPVSIKLKRTLICLAFIYSNILFAAELIFKDSFDLNFIGGIEIITPQNDQVVDQDFTSVLVRVVAADNNLQFVEINGVVAQFVTQNQRFADYTALVPLNQGENTITAIVYYIDQTLSKAIQTSYIPLPEIIITSPIDWQTLGGVGGAGGALNQSGNVQRPVTITGTINSTASIAEVQINQQQADFDSDSFTFQDFFLHEGVNMIDVTATDQYDRQTSSQITVFVDQSAPFLSVDNIDNHITSANSIDITGTVNDAISADFNAPMVSITINNITTGNISQAQVQGINYFAANFPLTVGINNILITATDGFENSRDLIVNVTRIAVGTSRITRFTGNNQSASANTQLPQPLIINVMDKDGLPLIGLPVHFDIIKGTGSISTHQNSQDTNDGVNPARNLVINTNDSGQAQIYQTLGQQAGLAATIIRVYNPTIAEDVYFTATTLTGVATKVQIEGAAGTQYAQTNSQPVDALTVIVSDEDNNPIANSQVIFTIEKGDAYFKESSSIAGQLQTDQSIITTTDNIGQAAVRPYIGTTASTIAITAKAIGGNNSPVDTAHFNIIALQRRNGPTQLTGIAMDQSGIPIAGIKFSIARTQLTAISNNQGFFNFPSQVPTGKIDLYIDGRDVEIEQAGETIQYPAYHIETAIIQGQQNQLPHPVYLPPVHIENTKIVGGDKDVTLTVPGFEGYKLIVKANSVTFPDGTRQGELVASPVYNDRLPMVPPGTGGSFMASGWTLQPSGTRFDPPIEVHIPNSDGVRPGTVLPVVQWDHDMAFFVPMGLGTISEDGSELVTQPHFGMSKAGWHGGLNPNNSNNAENTSSSIGSGCFAKILANNEDELWLLEKEGGTDVDFEVEFNQGCGNNDWTYDWRFYYGRDLSQYVADPSNEATPTVHYERPNGEPYIVSLVMQCIGCNSLTVILDTRVFVYTPDIVIKKDEEYENGWFELLQVPNKKYFAERTNLIIEVKYPINHPKEQEIITDYNGRVIIKEEAETQYYQDPLLGNSSTSLPDNLEIVEGILKISLDSDSISNPTIDGIIYPIDAKIKIQMVDFENLNSESKDFILVEQWVRDSNADVGSTNNPGMPDWLEKASWNTINSARQQPNIVGEVASGVNNIMLGDGLLLDQITEISGICGFVQGQVDKIYILSSCGLDGGYFRKDNDNKLNNTVIHEARHAWNNLQRTLSPSDATGASPINDSDKDGCPEIVGANSEADINDSTPIQDGTGTTGGDNVGVPYITGSECFNLNEADAREFGDSHDNI